MYMQKALGARVVGSESSYPRGGVSSQDFEIGHCHHFWRYMLYKLKALDLGGEGFIVHLARIRIDWARSQKLAVK